jgi:periplasmic protein TonB
MATHRFSIFGPMQGASAKKVTGPLRLPSTVKEDVFLNALLEMPTTKRARRSPLEWLGAMGFHAAIVAALIIVPLFTTATIHLNEYQEIPLVAPPPPLAPPPPPSGVAVAPHITHPKAKLNYTLQKLTAPTAIPKNISSGPDNAAEAAPELGGVPGGVPGGVVGGVVGGVLGGTGTVVPPTTPESRPVHKVVRVGSNLKPPRQKFSVNPVYPPLAQQARIRGTVVVDAVIDEHGNVVQARALTGHPLLIDAALKAVLQWKYEPTILNGQPVSVELHLQVNFITGQG